MTAAVIVALSGSLVLSCVAVAVFAARERDAVGECASAEAALESAEDELMHARAAVERLSVDLAAARARLEREQARFTRITCDLRASEDDLDAARAEAAEHLRWRQLVAATARRTGIALPDATGIGDDTPHLAVGA